MLADEYEIAKDADMTLALHRFKDKQITKLREVISREIDQVDMTRRSMLDLKEFTQLLESHSMDLAMEIANARRYKVHTSLASVLFASAHSPVSFKR